MDLTQFAITVLAILVGFTVGVYASQALLAVGVPIIADHVA